MRKLIPLVACLLTLLGLGVLVVQNTKAEAPRTSVPSVSEGTQGSESARTGALGGLNGVSQLGASSTPTTCIAYAYTLCVLRSPRGYCYSGRYGDNGERGGQLGALQSAVCIHVLWGELYQRQYPQFRQPPVHDVE